MCVLTRLFFRFDPTADSLHVGNLSILMTMRRLQEYGHKPIVLIGGATGLIGDPSGRESERPLLSLEKVKHYVSFALRCLIDSSQIEENSRLLVTQIKKFLDFSSEFSRGAEIVDNMDWYRQMSAINFLREIGKHLKVQLIFIRNISSQRLS